MASEYWDNIKREIDAQGKARAEKSAERNVAARRIHVERKERFAKAAADRKKKAAESPPAPAPEATDATKKPQP